jgi:pyruvate dehydrogenase E1 component alpha subunit
LRPGLRSARGAWSGQVAVSFFGDGATNEGIFHETLNMASLWKLPAIFVIGNNQYALSMPRSGTLRHAQSGRARALPMQFQGCRLTATMWPPSTRQPPPLWQRARSGEGPTLIECITYRALRPRALRGFRVSGCS